MPHVMAEALCKAPADPISLVQDGRYQSDLAAQSSKCSEEVAAKERQRDREAVMVEMQ